MLELRPLSTLTGDGDFHCADTSVYTYHPARLIKVVPCRIIHLLYQNSLLSSFLVASVALAPLFFLLFFPSIEAFLIVVIYNVVSGLGTCGRYARRFCRTDVARSGIFGYVNYLVERDRETILDTLTNGKLDIPSSIGPPSSTWSQQR